MMRAGWSIASVSTALAFGLMTFVPPTAAYAQCGLTSWYGTESGTTTASGERFKPEGLTAAHRTLPFGTVLLVCRESVKSRSSCVVVRVNDRGPHKRTGRDLDLSKGAARVLGMVKAGVARTCWGDSDAVLFMEMVARKL